MMADPRPVASTTKTSRGIALIAFLARLASFTISQIANKSAADYDTSAGLQRLECGSAATVSVPLAGATAMCTNGSTTARLSAFGVFCRFMVPVESRLGLSFLQQDSPLWL
jgi:hypothetical protein